MSLPSLEKQLDLKTVTAVKEAEVALYCMAVSHHFFSISHAPHTLHQH